MISRVRQNPSIQAYKHTILYVMVLKTFCRSLYSGVCRTLSMQYWSPPSPPLRITAPYTCTSPCERPQVWWPHNLTLFTTSRTVRAMISRVRQNSRNQATNLLGLVCMIFPKPLGDNTAVPFWHVGVVLYPQPFSSHILHRADNDFFFLGWLQHHKSLFSTDAITRQ